ncbi:MAG: Glyoxalase/bleomycin resistance protein/dioxygenase [Chthonomonadaceae bacterium]|nr:Glyoxalase/bleomycin resistance protein/dioxygenase [Chthonomonadaceae bacterium]
MKKPRLNLVVIRSGDIERSTRFYTSLGLHLEKHRRGNGPEHFASEYEGGVFEIYPRQEENDSTAGVRIGFQVAKVDVLVQKLAEEGAAVISPPKSSPWGRRAVVEDPDGHRVELTE